LNPLAALVEGYRDLFLQGVVPAGGREAWLVFVSAVIFATGATAFERARGEFADLV
jgi:ABC-type polysaccharide/polyol phosphate export permease